MPWGRVGHKLLPSKAASDGFFQQKIPYVRYMARRLLLDKIVLRYPAVPVVFVSLLIQTKQNDLRSERRI